MRRAPGPPGPEPWQVTYDGRGVAGRQQALRAQFGLGQAAAEDRSASGGITLAVTAPQAVTVAERGAPSMAAISPTHGQVHPRPRRCDGNVPPGCLSARSARSALSP